MTTSIVKRNKCAIPYFIFFFKETLISVHWNAVHCVAGEEAQFTGELLSKTRNSRYG